MATRKQVPMAATQFVVGECVFGDNGEEAKTVPLKMVARSGDPIDHWYWGRVVHDMDGMTMHKQRLPVDYIHDDGEVIGYLNNFSIEDGNLVASGALVPYRESDRASEVIYKQRQGVPYEASINFGGGGLRVEEVEDGVPVEVNGRQFTGPLTIVRQWPLRGVAVCPYGADCNTETSFSDSQTVEVEIMSHESTVVEDATETPADATAPAVEEVTPVETPEQEETQPEAEPAAVVETETAELTQGERYLAEFGDIGGVWFAQGVSYDEARTRFVASVVADRDAANARVEELTTEVAKLQARIAALEGEAAPVSFSSGDAAKRGGMISAVRIAGRTAKE